MSKNSFNAKSNIEVHGKNYEIFDITGIERKHGKPEKQAVAIAYSEKREAEKHCKHCGSKKHDSYEHNKGHAKAKALEHKKK